MPAFEYAALDANGNKVTGNVLAADLPSAAAVLSKRGLTVQSLEVAKLINDPLAQAASSGPPSPQPAAPLITDPKPAAPEPQLVYQPPAGGQPEVPMPPRQSAEVPRSAGPSGVRESVTPSQSAASQVLGPVILAAPLAPLGFYFRQLSTMLRAGVPLVQTASTLASQQSDPRMKKVAESVHAAVRDGRPISAGLEAHPESVRPTSLAMIKVGEMGGFLDDALEQVSEYIKREIELRNLYRRVTFYPKVIFFSSFVIIAAANAIISSVAPTAPGLRSPVSTVTWIVLGAILLGIWLFLRIGLQNRDIKRNWDGFVLKVPVIGKTMHELAMARFGRAFGALYKCGVPVSEAMQLAAGACGNEALREHMTPHFAAFDSGHGILPVFRATGAFSPLVLDMVATGETTGEVDQMLAKVSEYYEEEAATKQTAVATIVGVMMFLCVAVYIGYMIISFYSGYFGGIMQAANG